MALISLSIAPGARPDPRHETTYDAPRGGWFRASAAGRSEESPEEPSGQCSECGQRFPGWLGGVCDACTAKKMEGS